MTKVSPEITFVHYAREKPFSRRVSSVMTRDVALSIFRPRDEQTVTVVDLMNNPAVHGVHAGQQSPILQLLFSSEENHDSDIQLRVPFRNMKLFLNTLLNFDETSP